MTQCRVPVLGFVAPSGTGKTTLLRKLVPLLRERGLGVGYLKHSHHELAVDRPGKDSHALAAAGAEQVLLAAGNGWALMDYRPQAGPDGLVPLAALIERFDAARLDLVLIEGFRQEPYPKLEVYRTATGTPPLYPHDPHILAVATDAELPADALPVRLPIDAPGAIADFIVARLRDGQLAGEDPAAALLQCCRAQRRAGIEPRAGWLSSRVGEHCRLVRLALVGDDPGPADIVAYHIAEPEAADCGDAGADIGLGIAQTEALIHRQIYAAQPRARAVVGARMPYTAAVGFQGRSFEPLDPDGLALLGSVPALSLAPDEMARKASAIAERLMETPVCMLAGQGAYAWGADLTEALERAALLERSAQIFSLGRQTSV